MRHCLILGLLGIALVSFGCADDGGGGAAGSGGGTGGVGGATARGLVVDTASGLVQGFENDGVYSYRGIPYAAPPVGERRWRPPANPAPWSDTLDATKPGNICQQAAFGGLPVPGFSPSEDCLYLNVDTPSDGSDLPVMVWIHGGAFTLGEGLQTDGGTAGDRIARMTDTVVVSMNYRLGQFGFLAHTTLTEESEEGASGNYGLMDQTAALRWVEANIAQFGGDPDNVTIFGESAGAFSVCSHLVSAQSAGLFDKAILQSGSCERPYPTLSSAEAQGDAFAEELGCTDAVEGTLACMRAASAEDVLGTLPPAPNFGFNPTAGPSGSYGPIVDGLFMVEQPADSLGSGNFNQVPTVIGFTENEARLFVWLGEIADEPLVITEDNYEEQVAFLLGGNTELAADAVLEYPLADFSEPGEALAAVATDTIFRCPGKQEAAVIARFVPETYLFQFEYPDANFQLEAALPLLGAELPSYGLGAFHSADISYVFGYDPLLEIDFQDFSVTINPFAAGSTDDLLWQETLGYFTRFAATGDPNDGSAPQWPTYDAQSDPYLAIDSPFSVGVNAAQKCNSFWAGTDYLATPLLGD